MASNLTPGIIPGVRAAIPAPMRASTTPVIQRSSADVLMPGLDDGGGNKSNSQRGKGDDKKDDKEPPQKRVTRGSKAVFDLNRPRLTYQGAYSGVATQKQNVQQQISFDQNATLTKPIGAPLAAATYYDIRQQVRDGYGTTPAVAHQHALGGGYVQDGPFRPPYNDPNITVVANSIDFHDNPGFAGPTAIPAGNWLDWYEVRFQWLVTRRDVGGGGTWTSPEVTHRMDAAYNAGADVAIVQNSTAGATWDVVIP